MHTSRRSITVALLSLFMLAVSAPLSWGQAAKPDSANAPSAPAAPVTSHAQAVAHPAQRSLAARAAIGLGFGALKFTDGMIRVTTGALNHATREVHASSCSVGPAITSQCESYLIDEARRLTAADSIKRTSSTSGNAGYSTPLGGRANSASPFADTYGVEWRGARLAWT